MDGKRSELLSASNLASTVHKVLLSDTDLLSTVTSFDW